MGAIIGQNCIKRERKVAEVVTIKKEDYANSKSIETKPLFNKEVQKPKVDLFLIFLNILLTYLKFQSKSVNSYAIKDLFANASAKKSVNNKQPKTESPKKQIRKGDEGGIKGLFANAAAKKSKSIVENKVEPEIGEKENQDVLNMETEKEVIVNRENAIKEKTKSKKKRTKKEINSQPAKKRKRIVERNDSDSDGKPRFI